MVMAKLARSEMLSRIKERTKIEGLEVYGTYDAVLEIEANNVEDLYKKINEVNKVGLIHGLETYIVAREGTRKSIDRKTFAYILLDASPMGIDEVQLRVSDIMNVKKVDVVFGPFDIIVDISVENMDELNNVVREIVSIESVFKTCTLISSKIH
jgi:DNA-binding Lrp family transcriptional regulator